MVSHALKYASIGWQVFPIRAPGEAYTDKENVDRIAIGKEPGTAAGFKDATSDPAKIDKWWKSKPSRGMAIRTCAESGIWVLDSDDGGEDTIAELEAEHGALPHGPKQKTPSGGIHRIFKWPADGFVPRRIRFAPGLDALGERPGGRGGYFVIAPTVREDGHYEWIDAPDEIEPPYAPEWLLEMVRADGPKGRNVDAPRIEPIRAGGNNAYGEKALREEMDLVRGLPFGKQNEVFYKRCCRIGSITYGGSLGERYAFDSMVVAGMGMQNQPGKRPWSQPEIASIVRRGFAYGALDPNPPPARAENRQFDFHGHNEPLVVDGVSYDPETGEQIDEREDYSDFSNEDEPEKEAETEPKKPAGRSASEAFHCIGYNLGVYYYLPRGTGQIVALRASEHTTLRMLELADLNYWVGLNDGEKVSKETWVQFANALMRKCEQSGIFDERRMRGRGAWVDGKRIIVNTGSEAHIGGEIIPLGQVASRFIYQAGEPWEFGFGKPADSKIAHRLVQICERLTWDDKLSGALLSGWSVIAPVSGALPWRPHIWITGPSGAGKSTALRIIKRVVGPASEEVDGKVTEAAIRQLMGFDARPVIFDESEGESASDAMRMQQILDLARAASSGSRIPKGGQNGIAKVYLMRSAFCFSSIHTSVRQRADESRISRLVLRPNTAPDAREHYSDLVRDVNEWLTDEFASSMFSRTIENLPTLLKNIETFTTAAAGAWSSQRAADQIGPMLAGYYLCHTTGLISLAKAKEYIEKHQWGDYVAIDTDTDEMRLLQFIISRSIKIQLPTGSYETTIGSAIDEARSEIGSKGPYREALGARGIKVDHDVVAISDSAENTRAMFRDMPMWQADWKRPLRSIPGAIAGKRPERFAGGIVSRVTWIPYGHFDGTYVEREPGEEG